MQTSTSEARPEARAAAIKEKALALGFDLVRITAADAPAERGERLAAFLAAGRHGDMDWMERRADERVSPQSLWPDARSVVMLAMNYGPDDDPLARLAHKSSGVIASYVGAKDYHDVVKKRLKQLGGWIAATMGGDVKVFVDTAPVMEKPLASSAGIGWQGKHTNLVSRDFGSWLFLGSVFSTLELELDAPETDHCGQCRACLDICPTKAFPAPYQIDARRCISYLTIEHKGPIAHEFREAMGNRIYGCDDCLAVCPWNKFASVAREGAFHAKDELRSPSLASLSALDDAAFRSLFAGSPVKRTGRDRFVRNVMIAIGNSGDAALVAAAEARLDDQSPLVRGAAVWALSRLISKAALREIAKRRAPDADPSVNAEWESAA